MHLFTEFAICGSLHIINLSKCQQWFVECFLESFLIGEHRVLYYVQAYYVYSKAAKARHLFGLRRELSIYWFQNACSSIDVDGGSGNSRGLANSFKDVANDCITAMVRHILRLENFIFISWMGQDSSNEHNYPVRFFSKTYHVIHYSIGHWIRRL